ncbi:MAG: UDP-N-acetylmuramoyl-L-alanine--D-glutamate ligase [Anaerolineae bacterium]|nr:UDP-N-acetylmuramoyl-L-alanine--D-glutamate ligase [Anaerolineae bacterium]
MSESGEIVVIVGLARQGKALARYFAKQGVPVTVSDHRNREALAPEIAELADLDIAYVLGEHPLSLLNGCRLLCLSGGVPLDLPLVQEAVRRGVPLSNDAQEFLIHCPAPVIGITGSAGKTTTTTLVGKMLMASGVGTWVGGNIGNPLISDLEEIQPSDRVVMELSSFQLELMTVSPTIAGVLNITPNHLDRHKTMAAYVAAKRNIVAYQRADAVAVLGYDDVNARALAEDTSAGVRYFSGQTEVDRGAFLKDDRLILRRDGRDIDVVARQEVRLRGYHNVLNVLAAIALADAGGATLEGMRSAIRSFSGVLHRLEEVRRRRGALWVNDSIATAPERVLAALEAFDEPLVLLAGGRDKDLPWREFAERVVERVRVLVLFGEAAPLIETHVVAALDGETRGAASGLREIVMADTLRDAVAAAAERTEPGDVVLLSPGGTSFDAFRDFEERGRKFREWVGELPE